MTPPILTARGIDPWLLGWDLTDIKGWINGPANEREMSPIPGRMALAISPLAKAEPRYLDAVFTHYDATVNTRMYRVQEFGRLLSGIIPLVTIDRPGVLTRVRVSTWDVGPPDGSEETFMADGATRVSVQFHAVDGVSLEPSTTTVFAADGEETSMPLLDVPIEPVSLHMGPWITGAERTIRYYSAAGVLIRQITLKAPSGESLGSDDYLEVDHNYKTLTKVIAGVRSNANTWRVNDAGSRFLQFDDADRVDDASPYVVSEGDTVFHYIKAAYV